MKSEKQKGDTTTIEWVTAVARARGMRAAVWNPQRGCSRAGAGCDHCWAAKVAWMRGQQKNPKMQAKYAGLTRKRGDIIEFNGTVRPVWEDFAIPLKTSAPTVYFMGSETDLFHPNSNPEYMELCFDVAGLCPQHLFLVLTKRPDRMREFVAADRMDGRAHNVWLGTSVWDPPSAEKYIPDLLATPAEKHFVSYEPALVPVDFSPWWFDWLIAGCQSSPNVAMPALTPQALQKFCARRGIGFFYKQDVIGGKLVHLPEIFGKSWTEVPR